MRDLGLSLNDGTDSFTNQNLDADVSEGDSGELGNKAIVSGPGDDSIDTGLGNDVIDTGAGDDSASGDSGNDTISTGSGGDDGDGDEGADIVNTGAGTDDVDNEGFLNDGADLLDGGPGANDEIEYDEDAAVTVIIDGLPNDGHPGEGDNLLGFEDLRGSDGDDTIAGDGADNSVDAFAGNDTVSTGAGNDEIFTSEGNDAVDAGAGSDFVEGGGEAEGADLLDGGAGAGDAIEYFGRDPVAIVQDGLANDGRAGEGDNLAGFEGLGGGAGDDTIVGDAASNALFGFDGDDTLVGGAGNDDFFGGSGDDTINALGGRDEIECELGFDSVIKNAEDILRTGCERRGAGLTGESATVSKGKAKVSVVCPIEEGAPCRGKLVLLSNGKKIAKGPYKVVNGKTEAVAAKLSARGRKALSRSGGSLLVGAEARTTEPLGVTTSAAEVQLIR